MSQDNKQILLNNLGKSIREYRLKNHISQEELAFKIDSARNFVGCIERAEKSPTIYTLYKIARALGIKLSELLKEVD